MSARSSLPPERSGVYRSPPDVGAVEARAAAAGVFALSADLGTIESKRELLEALAGALALPKSFGGNWDALADSLQDLPLPEQGCVLRLKRTTGLRPALGSEWFILLEILADTATFWKDRGRAFVVFMDDATELPVWR